MKKQSSERRLFTFAKTLIMLAVTAVGVAGQSTDPDEPMPMKTESAKGSWPHDKMVSHYYSFTGGPGEIKIYFDFVSEGAQLVAGQLTDAAGRAFIPLENRSGDHEGFNYVQEIAYPQGLRLIATYNIRKRQKLVVRVYNWGLARNAGTYKVRVSGAGVQFEKAEAAK